MTHTVKVDSKGRLTIPAELRQSLGIEPGDTLFVEVESAGNSETHSRVLRYAKADNPFDALARHAETERRAGRTRNLRDFARELDIDLDAG
jgi:AbrB family looped-hinge helix DNA binding protein